METLTTNTARCSAGTEVVRVDDGEAQTATAAGVEEEEEDDDGEAIGSA